MEYLHTLLMIWGGYEFQDHIFDKNIPHRLRELYKNNTDITILSDETIKILLLKIINQHECNKTIENFWKEVELELLEEAKILRNSIEPNLPLLDKVLYCDKQQIDWRCPRCGTLWVTTINVPSTEELGFMPQHEGCNVQFKPEPFCTLCNKPIKMGIKCKCIKGD